jgi:hypothetical protein
MTDLLSSGNDTQELRAHAATAADRAVAALRGKGGAQSSGNLILAIDPGTERSGWCSFEHGRVIAHGVSLNDEVLRMLPSWHASGGRLAIEMIASYGMAVGREVFETCLWIGRFQQAWPDPTSVRLIYRKDIKLHLCGTPRAKDANIRQALLDKVGGQGVKAHPGPTYGIKSHAWAALAVAVTASELAA